MREVSEDNLFPNGEASENVHSILCYWALSPGGGEGGLLSTMEGSTRKGYLFHASYERVEISPVEVFKRVQKSVIWVCEKAQKGWRMNFMAL